MKKAKPYLITSVITLLVLSVIFIVKGIFPFGGNSLIWGDMHDQITAFYYHFYDCFKESNSLFINFSTGGSVNFLGILAYYILSPCSFLVLLVKREDIYLMVSVIIAFKILLSSLTCLYFIRYYFKKIPNYLSVLLAIIYAFSGYSLMMYQITPWIDSMYMFPLLVIGLKKVLDLEKPTFYIVCLTLSLIFSFYTSFMVIIFIFLASFIYLLVYKEEKTDRKKAILALGITTVISILLSLFIVIPSYMEISISSRIGFNMKFLLNSKMGPITDKIAMILFGGIVYFGLFRLFKYYKKNIKFLSFYIPVLLIMLIPLIIEPINKVWHFGSYAFFPYRHGFVLMLILILGACYSFENIDNYKYIELKKNKVYATVLTILISISLFLIIYSNFSDFQHSINTLTISNNHLLLLVLFIMLFISIIGITIIKLLNKNNSVLSYILIYAISISHILACSFIYLGMDFDQENLTKQYKELNQISKNYQEGDYFRVKNEANNMIMNTGMVMKYHTFDHFTSLTDKNVLESLKKMGYSSMWVKTFSRGGNLFLDSVLANKYIITRKNNNIPYYEKVNSYEKLNFYKLKKGPSYGHLMNNNDSIYNYDNSFQISNSIYKNITGDNNLIFELIDNFDTDNIRISKKEDYTSYEIVDRKMYSYLKKNIDVIGEKTLYLEILKSLDNNENYKMFEKFNVYVNGRLYKQKAFGENDNGLLNLGTYKDENISISIEFLEDQELDNITLGIMDNSKYEDFIDNYNLDTNISYSGNSINVIVNGKSDKILFLPISYNEGYKATNNNKEVEVIKLYDSFIGIKVNDGINNIKLTFTPKGFTTCLVISIISLIITASLIGTGLYFKIINNNLISNIAYYIYLTIYLAIILLIYVLLTIIFMISYFKII